MNAQAKFTQLYLVPPPALPELCAECNGVGGFEHTFADLYETETCELCQGTGFQQACPVEVLNFIQDWEGEE